MVLVDVINIIIFIIIHALRIDAASNLLNEVCSKTPTPNFCLSTIGAEPGAATADLKGLDDIALHLSLRTAAQNNALVQTLRQNTTEPVLSGNLAHCSVNYGGAIYALQQSIVNLEKGNFKAVGELAGICAENVKDCERVLNGGPSHPLKNENQKLIQLAGICDVIIGMLV
ncbi:pectinesterase inhibitor-like [Ziziphus jujuba]|uniref:Pectinesterase inhibitor-like n=1 Tax=Ziziphus jujuba TaxID=326968 RepID=A0A6P3ZPX2_ZIZJJ|nr:pectinesterase inhibitor-like [Ziziphus jujuba]